MKFIFYPVESRIYEFLLFPSLIHTKIDSDKQNQNHFEHIPQDFINLCLSIKSRLSSYQPRLERYYLEEVDIILLLAARYPFFQKSNADEYLDFLLTLEDRDILKAILYALQLKEWSTTHSEEAKIHVEGLMENEGKLMSWINELSLSGDSKWRLLCFSKDPKEGIKEFVQTMREIEPIFNEFYASKEKQVIEYGKSFVQRLNAIKGDALDEVSSGIVKNEAIPSEVGNIIISYFDNYSVHIYASSSPVYTAWGLEIETIFQKLSQENKNQLTNRILLFKNLGDKTRYEVLRSIAKGITSTKVIAEELGVSSATVSYHLSNLTTCKLIILLHQEGRYNYVVNHAYIDECFSALKSDLTIENQA